MGMQPGELRNIIEHLEDDLSDIVREGKAIGTPPASEDVGRFSALIAMEYSLEKALAHLRTYADLAAANDGEGN